MLVISLQLDSKNPDLIVWIHFSYPVIYGNCYRSWHPVLYILTSQHHLGYISPAATETRPLTGKVGLGSSTSRPGSWWREKHQVFVRGFAKGSLWWKKEDAASFLKLCWSMSSLPRGVSLPLDLQHNSAHRNVTKSSIPFDWGHQIYNSTSLLLKYWHYWNSKWNSSTLLSGFSSLHSWCVVIILEEPKTALHKSIGVKWLHWQGSQL